MRRLLVVLVTILSLQVFSSGAFAASFNPGPQLAASACGGHRAPVINAVEAVRNDDDSGVAGNAWASDDYMRTIQVWQVGTDAYCAIVRYVGSFTTRAGASPSGVAVVAAGVRGVMHGGYRSTSFTATLRDDPAWKTHGFVGVVDYQCDGSFNCPGRVSWLDQYFSSSSFAYAWWGWEYRAGAHGTWINSVDGNSGDIN